MVREIRGVTATILLLSFYSFLCFRLCSSHAGAGPFVEKINTSTLFYLVYAEPLAFRLCEHITIGCQAI